MVVEMQHAQRREVANRSHKEGQVLNIRYHEVQVCQACELANRCWDGSNSPPHSSALSARNLREDRAPRPSGQGSEHLRR